MGIFGLKNPDKRGKTSVFKEAIFGPEPGVRPIVRKGKIVTAPARGALQGAKALKKK